MESWRTVWRQGFVPHLSTKALEALRQGLANDDRRLLQGATTSPPPLQCVQDWPVDAACGLGYCGWQGEGLETVGEVEEFFARACFAADQDLGEPAACRHFLNWFDETPRDVMRHLLLNEVELALNSRKDRYGHENEEGTQATREATPAGNPAQHGASLRASAG